MTSIAETASASGGGTAIRIERVLCPIDFSEVSGKAYRYAQSIARHYRTKLILEHVVELWQHPEGDFAVKPEYYDEFRAALMSNAKAQLQELADVSGAVEPECVVEEGTAADTILCLARTRAASLIVMGTHGRRGFDHLMLGSVTERVLRNARCPVLAVPGKRPDETGKSAGADYIRRILSCVDFSVDSRRALDHAISVASAYCADLTVLHVLDNISESADVGKETNACLGKLQKLVPSWALDPARVHLEVRLGKPYREILDLAAQAQSDLIVTGVRGRNSLDLAVYGSTTYRVIQLHPGPVLTVPIMQPGLAAHS